MLSVSLFVIAVISSAAFGINKIANHFIFNRSDIVSAIGAFTAGILGNLYSRKMGGTAFMSVITGVLFLVPVRHFLLFFFSLWGLELTVCLCLPVWSHGDSGITADGSGIDIGGAMIALAIGVTVGLFMSQSIVYAFGSKNAAVMSFWADLGLMLEI